MIAQAEKANNTFIPDASNHRLLRDALGQFCTGITVVTANTDNGAAAITVNSFSSVSLTPPLVLWSIQRSSERYRTFAQAKHYSIHVLSHDQEELCMSIARDPTFIDKVHTQSSFNGVPVFDCLARFDCSREVLYTAGDHDIIIGRVLQATMPEHSAPLAFFAGATGTVTQHEERPG